MEPGGGGGGSEGGEVGRWCRLSVWVGGVGGCLPCAPDLGTRQIVYRVFFLDTRQTICLPCARKFAHGKSLDTRQTGRFP